MARKRRQPTSKMAPAKSGRGAPAKLQQWREDSEVKKHAAFMARQVKIAAKIRTQDSSSSESEDDDVVSAHIQVAKRGQKCVPKKDDNSDNKQASSEYKENNTTLMEREPT